MSVIARTFRPPSGLARVPLNPAAGGPRRCPISARVASVFATQLLAPGAVIDEVIRIPRRGPNRQDPAVRSSRQHIGSCALTYFEDLLLSPEPAGLEALLPAPAEVGGGLSWEAGLFPDPYPPFRRLVLRPDEPFPDVFRAMPTTRFLRVAELQEFYFVPPNQQARSSKHRSSVLQKELPAIRIHLDCLRQEKVLRLWIPRGV